MKRRKEVRCEGIKLPNSEVMKEVEKKAINASIVAVFRYRARILQ